jgi:hypothetical protein
MRRAAVPGSWPDESHIHATSSSFWPPQRHIAVAADVQGQVMG